MKFGYTATAVVAAAMQLVPLGQAALAADLPVSLKDTPYVVIPWQGLYVGGHVGGVWGKTPITDTYTYVGDPTTTTNMSSTGLIAGGQLGYNFQRGNIVFGPEADIGYLGASTSKSVALTDSPDCTAHYNHTNCQLSAKYTSSGGVYGDLTGRLGYAADRTLLYAKGGVAFLNEDFKANYAGGNCTLDNSCWGYWGRTTPGYSTFSFNHSAVMVGWTVGGGAEYLINPSWSLKAEYQHFDFGKMSYSYSGSYAIPSTPYHSTLSGKSDVSVTADAVSVGVNYHIGGDH
jgi:outer membrane immunogenic protein